MIALVAATVLSLAPVPPVEPAASPACRGSPAARPAPIGKERAVMAERVTGARRKGGRPKSREAVPSPRQLEPVATACPNAAQRWMPGLH